MSPFHTAKPRHFMPMRCRNFYSFFIIEYLAIVSNKMKSQGVCKE